MANWIMFGGRLSTELGVYVDEYPPLTLPAERAEFKPIPGRAGALTLLEGENVYDDLILSVKLYMRDLEKLDEVSAWLRGSGRLVLGNTPNRYYDARVTNQIELAKIMRGRPNRRFAAIFRCKPFRYHYPALPPVTLTISPETINNFGTLDAEPAITVVGSGDIALTVGENDQNMGAQTIYIAGLDSTITIDCATGMAKNESVNLTHTVTADAWPLCVPRGLSGVYWDGDVTSVTITRPWRYI